MISTCISSFTLVVRHSFTIQSWNINSKLHTASAFSMTTNMAWESQSYSDHLKEMLQEMFTANSFTDVTLVTDDKKHIQAHRNILSASSPVFKDIFQIDRNKQNHSVIYLRGVKSLDLEAILEFIYLSQTSMHEKKMRNFLLVAKDLQIKGLNISENVDNIEKERMVDCDDEIAALETAIVESLEEGKQISNASVHARVINDDKTMEFDNEKDLGATSSSKSIHNEKEKIKGVSIFPSQEKFIDENDEIIEVDSSKSLTSSVQENSRYQCGECLKVFAKRSLLKSHLKEGHKVANTNKNRNACKLCDQQFSELNSLIRHVVTTHEATKYNCKQCDFEASSEFALNGHVKFVHEKDSFSPFHLLSASNKAEDRKQGC